MHAKAVLKKQSRTELNNMEPLLSKDEIAKAMGQPVSRVVYVFSCEIIPLRGKRPGKGVKPVLLYYLSEYKIADAKRAWRGKEAQCRNIGVEYRPQEEIDRIEKIKADFEAQKKADLGATFAQKVIELRKKNLNVGAIAKRLNAPIHKVFEIVSRMPEKTDW